MGLLATSTIFYWTLFMLLHSFLVCDTHLKPFFANCAGVTAQARTVSGHKYQCSIFLENKFSETRVAAKLVDMSHESHRKLQAHLAHCGQFSVQLVVKFASWPSVALSAKETRMLGANQLQQTSTWSTGKDCLRRTMKRIWAQRWSNKPVPESQYPI